MNLLLIRSLIYHQKEIILNKDLLFVFKKEQHQTLLNKEKKQQRKKGNNFPKKRSKAQKGVILLKPVGLGPKGCRSRTEGPSVLDRGTSGLRPNSKSFTHLPSTSKNSQQKGTIFYIYSVLLF